MPVNFRWQPIWPGNRGTAEPTNCMPEPLRPLHRGQPGTNRWQGDKTDRARIGIRRDEATIVPELTHEVMLSSGSDLNLSAEDLTIWAPKDSRSPLPPSAAARKLPHESPQTARGAVPPSLATAAAGR